MSRTPIRGASRKTLLLYDDSYDAILEFFRRSTSGVTGGEAIRALIHSYGLRCKERLSRGSMAVAEDVSSLSGFAEEFFDR